MRCLACLSLLKGGGGLEAAWAVLCCPAAELCSLAAGIWDWQHPTEQRNTERSYMEPGMGLRTVGNNSRSLPKRQPSKVKKRCHRMLQGLQVEFNKIPAVFYQLCEHSEPVRRHHFTLWLPWDFSIHLLSLQAPRPRVAHLPEAEAAGFALASSPGGAPWMKQRETLPTAYQLCMTW